MDHQRVLYRLVRVQRDDKESMLPHHDGKEKDCKLVDTGNGDMTNILQEEDTVQGCLKGPPKDDEDGINGQLQRKLQELVLQDDDYGDDIIQDFSDDEYVNSLLQRNIKEPKLLDDVYWDGEIPNQQLPQSKVDLRQIQMNLRRKDGKRNDGKKGSGKGQDQKKSEKRNRGVGESSSQKDKGKSLKKEEKEPPLRFFDIQIRHFPTFEAFREGEIVGQRQTTVSRVPQQAPSFVVGVRNGNGPYAAVFVSMVPDLHLCNDYGDFRRRLGESFQAVTQLELENPTEDDLIPGYQVIYFMLAPREMVFAFDGIPLEEFKARLALITAWQW